MQKWLQRFTFLVTLFILVQCGRQNQANLPGNYEGVFILAENGSNKKGQVSLQLRDSSYQSTGQPNHIPAGGSGSWEIRDSELKFRDKNIWTADFDWHLILDGSYRYDLNRDSLILQAVRANGKTYTYRLKRIKP